VLHHLVENDLAAKIANGLMDLDASSAIKVRGKADWFDVRVKRTPLADPVFADSAMAVDATTLHSIRPVHILVHCPENGVDIACVEGAIGGGDKVVISRHDVEPLEDRDRVGERFAPTLIPIRGLRFRRR